MLCEGRRWWLRGFVLRMREQKDEVLEKYVLITKPHGEQLVGILRLLEEG